MNENEIVTIIIDKSMEIHRQLGPGLLENAYESILSFELLEQGLGISRQETIPIKWKTLTIDEAYRADLIVEDKVIVEIKSVEKLTKANEKQLLTYLRLSGKKLGLLLNFGQPLLKDGIERIINGKLESVAGRDDLFK
ncbi:MAG: GxxExxY protein [Rectinemataceae bacterium]|jgi:GxxExxY protein